MKKIGFAIFGLCLMLASCAKQELPEQNENGTLTAPDPISPDELVEMTISVTAPKTRTSLSDTDSDGVMDDVVWQAGDKISVWDGYANRKFFLIEGAGGTQAKFRGLIYYKATKVYALYPYCETFVMEVPPTDSENGQLGYARFLFANEQVQYAVENGYAADAAFAIAESDSPETMTFDQKTSLLKINLGADMNDVVSVKFSGNASSDYVWGAVSLRLIDAVTIWPGVINRPDINPLGRGKELILCNEDGSALKTGVDYYMVIPATEFELGYKVSFVHEDGTVSSRSSGNYIEYNTGTIYQLASGSITKSMLDSYLADYNKNGSVTVAGNSCLKSAYGEPVIIASNKTYTITDGGAYFIEPGAIVTLDTGSKVVSNLLIVGDNKAEMSKIVQNSSVKLAAGKSFAVLNMDYTFRVTENSLLLPTTTDTSVPYDINGILFDRNIIHYDSPKTILHSAVASVGDIRFYHNDIIFSQTGVNQWLFSTDTSSEPVYDEMVFNNNLFYHKGDFTAADKGFAIALGGSKTINTFSASNNTFVNLKVTNGNPYYVGAGTLGKAYLANNLVYMPNIDCTNGRFLNGAYTIDGVNYKCETYGLAVYTGKDNNFKYSSSSDGSYKFASDPFTTIDVANGIFIKSDVLYPAAQTNEIGAKHEKITGKRIRQ